MDGSPTRSTRLAWLTLGLAIGWGTVVLYVLHSALPHNVVELPLEKESQLYLWAPEGWKFFTRDPQEEWTTFYAPTAERWRPLQRDAAGGAGYAFGLSRHHRALEMEAALLLDHLSEEAWHGCVDRAPEACLADAAPVSVRNPVRRPEVCGELGVVRQRPVPWAWRHGGQPTVRMPARIARIHVEC